MPSLGLYNPQKGRHLPSVPLSTFGSAHMKSHGSMLHLSGIGNGIQTTKLGFSSPPVVGGGPSAAGQRGVIEEAKSSGDDGLALLEQKYVSSLRADNITAAVNGPRRKLFLQKAYPRRSISEGNRLPPGGVTQETTVFLNKKDREKFMTNNTNLPDNGLDCSAAHQNLLMTSTYGHNGFGVKNPLNKINKAAILTQTFHHIRGDGVNKLGDGTKLELPAIEESKNTTGSTMPSSGPLKSTPGLRKGRRTPSASSLLLPGGVQGETATIPVKLRPNYMHRTYASLKDEERQYVDPALFSLNTRHWKYKQRSFNTVARQMQTGFMRKSKQKVTISSRGHVSADGSIESQQRHLSPGASGESWGRSVLLTGQNNETGQNNSTGFKSNTNTRNEEIKSGMGHTTTNSDSMNQSGSIGGYSSSYSMETQQQNRMGPQIINLAAHANNIATLGLTCRSDHTTVIDPSDRKCNNTTYYHDGLMMKKKLTWHVPKSLYDTTSLSPPGAGLHDRRLTHRDVKRIKNSRKNSLERMGTSTRMGSSDTMNNVSMNIEKMNIGNTSKDYSDQFEDGQYKKRDDHKDSGTIGPTPLLLGKKHQKARFEDGIELSKAGLSEYQTLQYKSMFDTSQNLDYNHVTSNVKDSVNQRPMADAELQMLNGQIPVSGMPVTLPGITRGGMPETTGAGIQGTIELLHESGGDPVEVGMAINENGVWNDTNYIARHPAAAADDLLKFLPLRDKTALQAQQEVTEQIMKKNRNNTSGSLTTRGSIKLMGSQTMSANFGAFRDGIIGEIPGSQELGHSAGFSGMGGRSTQPGGGTIPMASQTMSGGFLNHSQELSLHRNAQAVPAAMKGEGINILTNNPTLVHVTAGSDMALGRDIPGSPTYWSGAEHYKTQYHRDFTEKKQKKKGKGKGKKSNGSIYSNIGDWTANKPGKKKFEIEKTLKKSGLREADVEYLMNSDLVIDPDAGKKGDSKVDSSINSIINSNKINSNKNSADDSRQEMMSSGYGSQQMMSMTTGSGMNSSTTMNFHGSQKMDGRLTNSKGMMSSSTGFDKMTGSRGMADKYNTLMRSTSKNQEIEELTRQLDQQIHKAKVQGHELMEHHRQEHRSGMSPELSPDSKWRKDIVKDYGNVGISTPMPKHKRNTSLERNLEKTNNTNCSMERSIERTDRTNRSLERSIERTGETNRTNRSLENTVTKEKNDDEAEMRNSFYSQGNKEDAGNSASLDIEERERQESKEREDKLRAMLQPEVRPAPKYIGFSNRFGLW